MATEKLTTIIEIKGADLAQRSVDKFNNNLDKTEKELKDVNKKMEKLESSTTATTKGLIRMGVGLIGLRQSFRFLKDIVKLAYDQETATAKLNNTLRATGNQLGLLASDFQSLASRMEETIGMGDEIISTKAISNMLTFKNINLPDIFERSVRASADLARTFNQDLKQSAIQVGKALSDPTVGITALRRIGVTFTKQEREIINNLVKMNRLADAQRTILDAIEGQVKGNAEAMALPLDKVNTQWRQLKETLGEGLLPALNYALPLVAKLSRELKNLLSDKNPYMLDAFQQAELYAGMTTEQLEAQMSILRQARSGLRADADEALNDYNQAKKMFEEQNKLVRLINAAFKPKRSDYFSNEEEQIHAINKNLREMSFLLTKIQVDQISDDLTKMFDSMTFTEDKLSVLELEPDKVKEFVEGTTLMKEEMLKGVDAMNDKWRGFIEDTLSFSIDFFNGWKGVVDGIESSFKSAINRMLNDLITSGLLTILASILNPGAGFIGFGLFGKGLGGLLGGGTTNSAPNIVIDQGGVNQRLDKLIAVTRGMNNNQQTSLVIQSRLNGAGGLLRSEL
jgi:hypothetical protein